MEVSIEKKYLELIRRVLEESDADPEMIDTEEGSILICSAASPWGEDKRIGYQFSVTPYISELVVLEIIMYPFNDIDKKAFDGINALIERIDPYLALGSFRLFDDSGSVMFTHSIVLSGEMEVSDTLNVFGKTVGIMENTVSNAGEYIHRFLCGEKTEDLIKEIDKDGEV